MEKSIFPRFSPQDTERIENYILETFHPEDQALRDTRERQVVYDLPMIQVGPLDGQILETLVRISGAQCAVEIGTLAGYSGLHILRGMGSRGHLTTIDCMADYQRAARETFKKNQVFDQATFLTGIAVEVLKELDGPFDLVFIDANKDNYPEYLEWAERNLRVGGTLMADNTLGWGMIANQTFDSPEDQKSIEGLRAFNQRIANSPRWKATLIPTAEGLTVATLMP